MVSTWLFKIVIDWQTSDCCRNCYAMMCMHDKCNRKGHRMVHKPAPIPMNADPGTGNPNCRAKLKGV